LGGDGFDLANSVREQIAFRFSATFSFATCFFCGSRSEGRRVHLLANGA
jgi:hypothetical protein